jgi:hypothetical protein
MLWLVHKKKYEWHSGQVVLATKSVIVKDAPATTIPVTITTFTHNEYVTLRKVNMPFSNVKYKKKMAIPISNPVANKIP